MNNNKIMKKLLIVFLFYPLCAFSEWKMAGITAEMDFIFFVDDTSIRRDSAKVKYWMKVNVFRADQPFLSSRQFVEINCDNQTSRTLSYQNFSKHDLKGEIVGRSETPLQIINIPPDTSMYSVMEFVCK